MAACGPPSSFGPRLVTHAVGRAQTARARRGVHDTENGTVLAGSSGDEDLFFVDTEGNQGRSVDLKADDEPAYYKCGDKEESDEKSTDVPATSPAAKALPRTGDATAPLVPMAAAAVLVGIAGFAARRREQG